MIVRAGLGTFAPPHRAAKSSNLQSFPPARCRRPWWSRTEIHQPLAAPPVAAPGCTDGAGRLGTCAIAPPSRHEFQCPQLPVSKQLQKAGGRAHIFISPLAAPRQPRAEGKGMGLVAALPRLGAPPRATLKAAHEASRSTWRQVSAETRAWSRRAKPPSPPGPVFPSRQILLMKVNLTTWKCSRE